MGAPLRILAVLLIAVVPVAAGAEVHRCKDAAGKTYFSDRGCAAGGGEKMRGAPDAGAHSIGTRGDDEGLAQRCLEQYRAKTGRGTPDTTRVENFRVRWVTVRDVGARRLFDITIGVLNQMGYWAGTVQHQCLLRGDNVSFQTTPYELVN
jgi:hypothetical protein